MEEFELEPGETITKSVRRHWFVLAAQLVVFLALALFPLFIPTLFSSATSAIRSGAAQQVSGLMSFSNPLLRFALGIWWLFIWMGAFTVITLYFLSVWVITNTRIVNISQRGLFSRKVSSTLLARVQDVTTDVDGLFSTLFGYGTLTVQTAGTEEELTMEYITGPEHLRDFIMREVSELHVMNQTGV
jgi:uncharacterized membrane protein YdbT with pleckstrin-like domain